MNDLPSEDPDLSESSATAHLVGRIRAGAHGDFDALYERVAPALYAWTSIRLRRLCRSDLDPEDVLQEVWLRAYERFDRFRPDRCRFRGWILGVAKHVLLEELRRKRPVRSGPEPSCSGAGSLDRFRACTTSIASRLARDEAMQRFLAQVEELDPLDGMILLHRGFEEFSNAEAATRLGISTEAVKKRWQRLRSRLAEGGLGRAFFGAA